MTAHAWHVGGWSRHFPLPREVRIGNQHWTVFCNETCADDGRSVVLLWLLSGPYERHRTVRIRLDADRLLSGAYDAERAAELVRRWLPSSDRDEVFELSGRDLLRPGQLPRPSDDEV